jgi:hypothetical protein
MFSTGAKIDVKRLEEEIRKEIEEKARRLFTPEELEELQKFELHLIPNPDRVRTFFHRELDFPSLDFKDRKGALPETKYYQTDYNIDLQTFLASTPTFGGRIIAGLRSLFRPFFRLYGNIDALIYKQAVFNREQVQFNFHTLRSLQDLQKTLDIFAIFEKPFHYIRSLHTLVNYLVAELTKLNLQHQQLKGQVEALAYDLEQLKKRERLLEKMAVLKENKP